MNVESEYGLILPFDDQSQSFVHGFEAGQIYEALSLKPGTLTKTVHHENSALWHRMGACAGYSVSVSQTNVLGWDQVIFTLNGKRLQVVP